MNPAAERLVVGIAAMAGDDGVETPAQKRFEQTSKNAIALGSVLN
jgi:hypothetical protein